HTRFSRDWSSVVCSSDLAVTEDHADPVLAHAPAELRPHGGTGVGLYLELATGEDVGDGAFELHVIATVVITVVVTAAAAAAPSSATATASSSSHSYSRREKSSVRGDSPRSVGARSGHQWPTRLGARAWAPRPTLAGRQGIGGRRETCKLPPTPRLAIALQGSAPGPVRRI